MRTLPLLVAAALAALSSQAQQPAAPVVQVEKKAITSADQLPRRSYTITRLPSELIDAPKSELDAVVAQIDRDIANDLATLDIRDRAARAGMLNARFQFAIHRGDYPAALEHLRTVRSEQDKPAQKLTSGVSMEQILQARMKGGSVESQREAVRASLGQAWGAMPWDVVGDTLKQAKSGLELMSREVAMGGVTASLDPAAKNLGFNVPAGIVTTVVAIRNQFEHLMPFREDMVAVLQKLVDGNQVAKADNWSKRLVSIPGSAPGKPVVVGIWDSGTDVGIFKPAQLPGIAFDRDWLPVKTLVRPMGPAESRLPTLKQYIKGAMDMQAAIDSEDARTFKKRVSSLKQDEVKPFMEDMAATGMWVHGTHVAGIAVEGNPFAQVTTVAMHFSHEMVPLLPTEERVQRGAAAFKASVEHFKKAGARVVNMSWRYSPQGYESALAYHNVGKTPEERKLMAIKLFEVEKRALEEAIASAPEILFVAGAGNENNSADFAQYIPAGLQLPNLITAGAVDMSGVETQFSTFGKTVAVHANGFEVVSFAPGGDKLKLSGTSMASPQVANLAAKLFALKPELTVAQVKDLIVKGAEKNGRVNLINPRETLRQAGISL